MDESELDAAFFFDAELRARLRAVAGALWTRAAYDKLTPPDLSIDKKQEMEKAGEVLREPSMMRDARVQAAMVALVLAEPPTCAVDAAYVKSTLRAARETAMMFEPDEGADTHVALATARVLAAGTVMQLHDAARMLALLPPRYDPYVLHEYGLAVQGSGWLTKWDADALWSPIVDGTLLSHGEGYERTTRPKDWGVRARAAVERVYLELADMGLDKYRPFGGTPYDPPRATDPSECETLTRAKHAKKAPYTEADVTRMVFEDDANLNNGLRAMRRTLLDVAARIAQLPASGMSVGYEATMDWINMLAMLHALWEGVVPNQAPWNEIRDVMVQLFNKLNWYLDNPSAPPGVQGLCVLLRAKTQAQFHDGARIFAGLPPLYRAAPPTTPAAREGARVELRRIRDDEDARLRADAAARVAE